MIESIYIGIIVVLFLLAISDLIVGVSNDAVNFLNSSIGSKVASLRTIMIIAGIGILVGASFSNGMMEVARKGIFHPEKLYFSEIMILFLAVMLTDIILLDVFNTFGLPTSTTVSIVFELLGATIGIALIKTFGTDTNISTFINTSKALEIISGILLSIIVAFTLGAIVQYITRIVFTFNYQKTYKYFGSVFGGLAITSITYFLIIKGAKGSSFISEEMLVWVKTNSLNIIVISFVVWTIILQIFISFFKANIFKFIVLVGTFTLAMAFAGNDLVNFIGVPLAGLASYKAYAAQELAPDALLMISLTKAIKTPTMLLLIAGAIMAVTLWLSKKAKSVTQTEITLGRQEEGEERFQASYLSRIIVKIVFYVAQFIKKIIPYSVQNYITSRFDSNADKTSIQSGAHFDIIRASVILFVASIIISFATSLKLPLSTTYVTFMVAMGASLSDRAWGRESAVYRITGVLTVVGGWFFTAFAAFTISFLFVLLIQWGGVIIIALLIALIIFILINTHVLFKNKEKEKETFNKWISTLEAGKHNETIRENTLNIIKEISKLYHQNITGLISESLKKPKKARRRSKSIKSEILFLKDNIHSNIKKIEKVSPDFGIYYIKIAESLHQLAIHISNISKTIFNHLDNKHYPLLEYQQKNLNYLDQLLKSYIQLILSGYETELKNHEGIVQKNTEILKTLYEMEKEHIQEIQNKNKKISKRNTSLYIEILNETEYLTIILLKLVNFEKDYIQQSLSK